VRTRIALVFACLTFGATGLVLASTGASGAPYTPGTINIGSQGGLKTIYALVRNARTCAWTSSPRIAGFDVTVNCKTGEITRSANFPSNHSKINDRYTITLIALGKMTTVKRWTVVEAGYSSPSKPTPTTTTTIAQTTSTPYTYSIPADDISCAGHHVVTSGQPPEDIETCLLTDVTSGVATGTFTSNPGSSVGDQPTTSVGQVGWFSDYYKAPTLASSWTIVSTDTGNETYTWNITAFYAGLTVPFTPAPTVSTPYTYDDVSANASCTGHHVVTAGKPPEDIETCLFSDVAPGSIVAGTFSSNPDSFDGTQPFAGVGQVPWASDYYPIQNFSVDATSWTIVSIDNGNGAFTENVTAYYNGLNS
jgi:hypothetical protein